MSVPATTAYVCNTSCSRPGQRHTTVYVAPTSTSSSQRRATTDDDDDAMDEAIADNQRAAELAAVPVRSLQPSLTPDILKILGECVAEFTGKYQDANEDTSSLISSLRAEIIA